MTLAELEIRSTEALLEGYSDCYKSLYNVRPHGVPTREALIQFWLTYDADFDSALAREKAEEKVAADRLEADITKLLEAMPHASRADAVRLLIQSVDVQDEEGLEYEYGVCFGYLKQAA